MAGSKPIRPTTSTQARSKEKKNTASRDGPEQASPSESSNMVVGSPEGRDVDDFEDDPTVWNPIASQLGKAIENVKKPDHWPRDFARRVKDRQSALVEELKVKSEALTTAQQTFASQFHRIVAIALAPATGSDPDAEAASSAPSHPIQNIAHLLTPTTACQPLHQTFTAIFEESKTLLAQYQQHLLEIQQQQSSEPHQNSSSGGLEDLAKTFASAKHHATHAIAAGRRVADADIDDMLADRLREVREGGRKPAVTAEEEALGRDVLRLGRGQRPELASAAGAGVGVERDNVGDDGDGGGVVCWGKVAHRAQRAVERLVRVSGVEE